MRTESTKNLRTVNISFAFCWKIMIFLRYNFLNSADPSMPLKFWSFEKTLEVSRFHFSFLYEDFRIYLTNKNKPRLRLLTWHSKWRRKVRWVSTTIGDSWSLLLEVSNYILFCTQQNDLFRGCRWSGIERICAAACTSDIDSDSWFGDCAWSVGHFCDRRTRTSQLFRMLFFFFFFSLYLFCFVTILSVWYRSM